MSPHLQDPHHHQSHHHRSLAIVQVAVLPDYLPSFPVLFPRSGWDPARSYRPSGASLWDIPSPNQSTSCQAHLASEELLAR